MNEGWNFGIDDVFVFYVVDLNGFFVVMDDIDILIVVIFVVNYIVDFVFFGLYIVCFEYCGIGIGYGLW